jgi:hypothetical protein
MVVTLARLRLIQPAAAGLKTGFTHRDIIHRFLAITQGQAAHFGACCRGKHRTAAEIGRALR